VSIDVLEHADGGNPSVTEQVGPCRRRPRPRTLAFRALVGVLLFLVVGNGVIMASMAWFRLTGPAAAEVPDGIDNLRWVDSDVLRGAAPSEAGIRKLAKAGVTTIVDLRAEADLEAREDLIAELGMKRFHLPVRDGQLPSESQAAAFLEIVEASRGAVFVHCGAGVGRTGALSAFYLNASGQTRGLGALARNLAVGPPSLEQIVFAVKTSGGEYDRPGPVVTAVSRVLDAPRRIWHNLT
jgi:protein tyrosine phosphatase (PTP) superfamily phosphohydrolase (DUF442 family)